jgi:hypothetical protein
MAVSVMHGGTVKLRTMIGHMLSPRRERPMITFPVVQMMVYVAIEMFRSVKPRSCPDKHATRKPLRPVVAIRSAIIRRDLVVAIRTNRSWSNFDGNLRGCCWSGGHENAYGER